MNGSPLKNFLLKYTEKFLFCLFDLFHVGKKGKGTKVEQRNGRKSHKGTRKDAVTRKG